jgi:hypothetical protein
VAETSFPVAGGAGVTDAAYERLMGPIMGAGRYGFSPSNATLTGPLIYADASGRQVKAYANQSAIIRGFRWESGSTPPTIALDANTSGNPRQDLIVLRLTRSTYTVRLAKINGTPASSPAAPSPVQDTGSTGVYDIPLASVRVTSNGTTGQPTIQAADVTPLDWWITPPGVIAVGGRGPAVTHGQLVFRPDTGQMFQANGTTLNLLGERGARTKLDAASIWTTDNVFCQRVNGFVFFQALAYSNTGSKPAGTDLTLCTIPLSFRPANDIGWVGYMDPGQACEGLIVANTGQVLIRDYGQTFPAGGMLNIAPMTWPTA